MNLRNILFLISCLLSSSIGLSQANKWDSIYQSIPQKPDSLRFNELYNLSLKLAYSNKSKFLKVTNEASSLIEHLKNKNYASAKMMDAWGKYQASFGSLDSSKYYWDRAMTFMEKEGDIRMATRYKNWIGIANRRQANYDEALKIHLETLATFEELGDSVNIYRVHNALGAVNKQLGNSEKAIYHYQKMLDNAIRKGNKLYQADGYTNIGQSTQDKDLAISYYEKAIAIYKQLDKKTAIIGTILKLATIYNREGDHIKQIKLYDEAEPYVIELNSKLYQADLFRGKGLAMNGLKRYDEAIQNIEKSRKIYNETGNLIDEIMSLKYLYIAQSNAGQYKEAFKNKSRHAFLRDSTRSIEIRKNISELETKYETAKKDAEIIVLNKNIEIQNVKRQRLWGGLLLLSLTGLTTIFGIIQRNKKRQAILQQQKAIAVEKQEKAEQQLEFKKKELLAKVLQLSKKNEFLQNLEQEVNQLKSTVGGAIAKSTSRIDRMITNDAIDEEEWEQFSKEFSSVHEGFIQNMTQKYGTFTQSEIRLTSLLKMNLSSKEIANILRISDEGIKKARYRLRKKMNLETGDDLQGLIMSIKS